jgi:O-antigen ligase
MSQSISFPWRNSGTARIVDYIAAAAAFGIICRLVAEENVAWLGFVVLGACVLALSLVKWPYGALVVLISTSVMPRFFVEISTWKLRPEDFGAAVVSLVIAGWFIFRRSKSNLEALDLWIVAYILFNYISSAFGSPEPSSTLRWALQDNLAVLPYFLIRFLIRDLRTLRNAFCIFLVVGVLESIYGILCFASYRIFDTTMGVEVGQYMGSAAGPYGSMYEANLFGAYAGCCAVLFLALYLTEKHSRAIRLTGFFITSIALFVSLSRGALLAYIIAVLWLLARNHWSGAGPRLPLIPIASIIVIVWALSFTPVGEIVKERFTNLINEGLTEETAMVRFVVFSEAALDILKHPILGTGTASFNLTFQFAEQIAGNAGDKVWIGNAPLRIFHDTGILGFTAIVGFFVSLWIRLRRGLRSKNADTALLMGSFAGALLYGISFQLTEGTHLAFFWVFVGLVASSTIFAFRTDATKSLLQSQS